MTLSPAEYLLRLREAEASYAGFLRLRYPDRDFPPFQQHLIDVLDQLEKGTFPTRNVLITMPPRHGKSEYCTVNFPLYYMGRDPRRYVMSSSYNSILAQDFGRQVRDGALEHQITQVFPNFKINKRSTAVDVWGTTEGGRYFGIGIGATTSGRPANLLIVDDPFKNREEADSLLVRNKVWKFYTSALSSRLQPTIDGKPPIQLVILTRWHPDDLAGRLMETHDWKHGLWTHVDFPAISLRPDGFRAALWPERFSIDWLDRRQALDSREFEALYQQRPFVEGGNLFQTSWIKYEERRLFPANFVAIIITADTAYKTNERNDYSAIVVAGMDRTGQIYILDVIRKRLESPELIREVHHQYLSYRFRGLRAVYIEDKTSGTEVIQHLRRQGVPALPLKTMADKVARANTIIPIVEAGRVTLPQGAPWFDDFWIEMKQFPNGRFDDQVDAFIMALEVLQKTHVSPDNWDGNYELPQPLDTYGKSLREHLGGKSRPGWGL